ncbi:unnamed protein product [Protopolystoma xenopodis]|uniref:Uncharacterized protein n=1 Tax=Protopolystoma xenopodis TaxID=117903 RepID=A0A448XQG4_9PLAT|nr:unnamed protein product [Protopolystoma xenopodis]
MVSHPLSRTKSGKTKENQDLRLICCVKLKTSVAGGWIGGWKRTTGRMRLGEWRMRDWATSTNLVLMYPKAGRSRVDQTKHWSMSGCCATLSVHLCMDRDAICLETGSPLLRGHRFVAMATDSVSWPTESRQTRGQNVETGSVVRRRQSRK